jgi:hypothetical protein
MIGHTIKKISRQLESLTKCDIKIGRALDILEATTRDLEEVIAINTLRESLCELASTGVKRISQHMNTVYNNRGYQPAINPA